MTEKEWNLANKLFQANLVGHPDPKINENKPCIPKLLGYSTGMNENQKAVKGEGNAPRATEQEVTRREWEATLNDFPQIEGKHEDYLFIEGPAPIGAKYFGFDGRGQFDAKLACIAYSGTIPNPVRGIDVQGNYWCASHRMHKPSPWFVMANLNETSPLHPLCSVWAGRETQEHIICNSCTPDNARLIAAAPELLEALQEADTVLATLSGSNPRVIDTILKNRAAIAKAEGRAS